VGKSTLISRISAARPKIADYPFTTLEPHLGVVALGEYDSFVVADIPGLIEGAHQGHGLGTRFLRHIERTRLLVHLVDVSAANPRDPVADYHVIVGELTNFQPKLALKPVLVVASKIDAAQNPERLQKLEAFCRDRELPLFAISAVTGEGLDKLKYRMAELVREERLQETTTA
jgi:GTP-binding protein